MSLVLKINTMSKKNKKMHKKGIDSRKYILYNKTS
jgi:hypothetical protein